MDDTSELDLPYVAGLSVRFGWADLETSPGNYDWSQLKRAHRIAAAKNKLLMIRVIAGVHSPQWLYTQGVPIFTFQGSETNWMPADAVVRMPVPWSENYLQNWEGFLNALGKEISGWPEVYCVHMTGGGFIDEMHLPKRNPATIQQWKEAGISDEKLLAMWKRIIVAYDKSMPANVGLTLAFGIPFAQSKTPDLVYHHALERYPGRVWFQQNGLKAERAANARFPEMLRAASTKTVVGYQMLGGGRFLDAQTGDRRVAFSNAMQDHSSYVEVYRTDLLSPRWKGALQQLAEGLRDRSN